MPRTPSRREPLMPPSSLYCRAYLEQWRLCRWAHLVLAHGLRSQPTHFLPERPSRGERQTALSARSDPVELRHRHYTPPGAPQSQTTDTIWPMCVETRLSTASATRSRRREASGTSSPLGRDASRPSLGHAAAASTGDGRDRRAGGEHLSDPAVVLSGVADAASAPQTRGLSWPGELLSEALHGVARTTTH